MEARGSQTGDPYILTESGHRVGVNRWFFRRVGVNRWFLSLSQARPEKRVPPVGSYFPALTSPDGRAEPCGPRTAAARPASPSTSPACRRSADRPAHLGCPRPARRMARVRRPFILPRRLPAGARIQARWHRAAGTASDDSARIRHPSTFLVPPSDGRPASVFIRGSILSMGSRPDPASPAQVFVGMSAGVD